MNDGRKRKAPKHQNKTAFKIQFDPLTLEIHKKLCKRCANQISWKLKYNKYKRMTEPAKCTFCHQKNVYRTYMRACQRCMEQNNVCPKCLQTETEEQIEVKLNQIQQKKQDQQIERKMNEFLKTLKERSRRTVRRLFQKEQNFVDVEGNILPVQFRQGYGPNKEEGEDGSQNQSFDQFGSDFDQDGSEDQQESSADPQKTKKEKQLHNHNKKSKKQKDNSQSDQDSDDDLDDLDGQDNEENQNEPQGKNQEQTEVKQEEDDDWQDEQSQNSQEVQQKHPKKSKKQKPKK